MLLPLLFVALGLVSCDDDDWKLEERLVGEWGYYYEDHEMYEEEIFNFTPQGMWTSSYRYGDIWGHIESTVDGGYFEVNYGRLVLYSEFFDDVRTYDIRFFRDRMYMSDGHNEMEYVRYR